MNTLTNPIPAGIQVIYANNAPAFVVIPYAEYEQMHRKLELAAVNEEEAALPLEVFNMRVLKHYSLPKAWRLYRHLTQEQVAAKMGISQSAYSQIEKSGSNQAETMRRLSQALGCIPAQLAD